MKNNPLIENAIKRNEDALIGLTPGTPAYQECKNRIERHRHDSIMEMLVEISKPKKIEKIIMVVAILALLIGAASLYFQAFGASRNPDTKKTMIQGEELPKDIDKSKSPSAYDLPKSFTIPPKIKNNGK